MLRALAPVLLFLAALVVRLAPWASVYQRDGVHPIGNDAYYHLRRIRHSVEHFPDVLRFDPLINFPDGAQPIWSPTFDWSIAALLRMLPGVDPLASLERLVVWVPPLIGAATIVLVYVVGLRFFSRTTGWLAAGALVVMPGHSLYSILGAIDHHVLVAALSTGMLALAMESFREHGHEGKGSRGPGVDVALGLSMAAVIAVWPGALLHVGVLQVAMVLRVLTTPENGAAIASSRRFALAHLVAGVAVSPLCVGNEWIVWGSFSPVVLSNFQPLYLLAGSACFGGLALVGARGGVASGRPTRAVAALGIGAVALLASLVAIPGLAQGIQDALSWFARDEEFQSIVSESVPLLSHRDGSSHAERLLSRLVYGVPFAIAWLTWRLRARAEALLLLGWTGAFFVATLVQWRFVNTYSVAHCLLIALVLTSLYEEAAGRGIDRRRMRAATAVAAAGLVFAFLPSLRHHGPDLASWLRHARGLEGQPIGMGHTRLVTAAARFLHDHTAPADRERFAVLGSWNDGHLLKYVARVPVVQDNFGDDVAPENFRRAGEYFVERDESQALRIIEPTGTRYVLVGPGGSGQARDYAHDSLFTRLYLRKGSRGRPRERTRRRLPIVDALHRHRLIYLSPPLRPGAGRPHLLLFEIVPGAELVGRADPGAEVRLSLSVRPRGSAPFDFATRVRADEEGEYVVRLPYSNEPFSASVRVGDHYSIRSGDRRAELAVAESAVANGERVAGPDLGSPPDAAAEGARSDEDAQTGNGGIGGP